MPYTLTNEAHAEELRAERRAGVRTTKSQRRAKSATTLGEDYRDLLEAERAVLEAFDFELPF